MSEPTPGYAAAVYSGRMFARQTHRDIEGYVREVRSVWRGHWAKRPDHRYGKDFAAFLGERLLSDFDLREDQ